MTTNATQNSQTYPQQGTALVVRRPRVPRPQPRQPQAGELWRMGGRMPTLTDIEQAQSDREGRAVEVVDDYLLEPLELPGMYLVTHPAMEDDRTYLVDMAACRCNCPDYSCTAAPNGILCKHIIGVSKRFGVPINLPPALPEPNKPFVLPAAPWETDKTIDPFERI